MSTKRQTGLILRTIIVGTMVTAITGPVKGQDNVNPRTGKLNQDCNEFSGSASGDKYELKAQCRTDDDTNNRAESSVDLAENIGLDGWGYLEWGGSLFHKDCKAYDAQESKISVKRGMAGVELEARCKIRLCSGSGASRDCSVHTPNSDLSLQDYYEVDSSGNRVVK